MTLAEASQTVLKVKLRAGASVVKVRPLFTYDSKCIILASGSDVKIYNIQSGECIRILQYHVTHIVSLQENTDNPLQFYSCSADGKIVRWDLTEGKILQTINLKYNVEGFYAPASDNLGFAITKRKDAYRLSSFSLSKPGKLKGVLHRVYPHENVIAFGAKVSLVSAIYDNFLYFYDFKTEQRAKHFYSNKLLLKCVACHPSDFAAAVGDSEGKITLWTNIWDSKSPIRSIYHWHHLPVSTLSFSTEGSYLYSGGEECVLVKWNLFQNERSFLPRVGAPICGLNVSKEDGLIVTSLADNTLQIINSQRVVVQVIQDLTLNHFQGSKVDGALPTGLLYDSLTKSLVLNGKPGHLQFYDIHKDKQLFHLDITGRSFVTRVRDCEIFNTDVQRAAVDEKGHWLATVEYWHDGQMSPQIWLKFWEFDVAKQTFVENTNVFLPHKDGINCMMFQPQGASENVPSLVTTSRDSNFKIWKLNDDVDFSDKKSWTCDAVGYYRDFPANGASFSEDGSLLAVAFDKTATLWTVDITNVKAALYHEKNENEIRQLMFGRKSYCHLLLTHDGTTITAWNVLSLSISWILHNPVEFMVADMYSDIFAAFCCDKSMVLFCPENPEPIFYMENVSKKPVVSAVFVPSKKEIPVLKNSQLFFMDEDKNLWSLTDGNQDEQTQDQMVTVAQHLPVTPFARLQPETKVSDVKAFEQQPLFGLPRGSEEFDLSCPTYIDPVALCSKILKSLLIPAQKKES